MSLPAYYAKKFPAEAVAAFYGAGGELETMELAIRRGETMTRHLHVKDANELRALCMNTNGQVDVGAHYVEHSLPGLRSQRVWLRRLLVLDVDKYVRCGNCPEKQMCEVCWASRLVPVVESVYRVVTDTLGLKAVPIFTGSRGAHVIVTDTTLSFCSLESARDTFRQWVQDKASEQAKPFLATIPAFTKMERFGDFASAFLEKRPRAVLPFELDQAVAKDPTHLSRIIFSVNQHTNRVAMPFTFEDTEFETVAIDYRRATKETLLRASSFLK